ncbi:MAG: hypothetical protein QXY45_02570 [Candidatus Aenigmatarchaeota archaeon]
MPIKYPAGPCPPECTSGTVKIPKYNIYTGEKIKNPKTKKDEEEVLDLNMYPGEGIFAQPFESLKYLDFEFPMGIGSAVYLGLLFQLGKWGYQREEVNHSMDVSPIYKEYYALVMDQKEKLESQVRNGFATLVQAIQDLELIDHDLRKYKEYLDWFVNLEKAKKNYQLAKESNKSEEEIKKAEKEYKNAQHVIKSIFIDQVDAHTGESLSLRGIAPRWPTIISDFMDIYDEDLTVEDIQKRLDVPKAEAVILKTKNELYRYWKETFLTNIISRYRRLKQLAIGRKHSVEDTRRELIPIISRYKAIKDMRGDMGEAANLTHNWSRLDAQAVALDIWKVWAWKPFVVKQEPFPNTRFSETNVPLKEAGFNKEEIEILKNHGMTDAPAMPALPIMDRHLRNIIKLIYHEYKVLFGPKDVLDCANEIFKRFQTPETSGSVQTDYGPAVVGGPRWEFSPYYIFLSINVVRYVLKLPNGAMLEDIMIDPMQAFNATQNIIIGHMLELKAIRELERRTIANLLGYEDVGGSGVSKLDEILKREYPEFDFEKGTVDEKWLKEKKEEKKKSKNSFKELIERFEEFKEKFTQKSMPIVSKLGLYPLMFVYKTPYEKLMFDRMSKMMQRGPGVAFLEVDTWLKRKASVPGV